MRTSKTESQSGSFEFLRWEVTKTTYKLEQERVLPQRADATGEPQDEHHAAHHQEQPHRIKTPEVRDGRDVGEDALATKQPLELDVRRQTTAIHNDRPLDLNESLNWDHQLGYLMERAPKQVKIKPPPIP